jgi:hypothetical protein
MSKFSLLSHWDTIETVAPGNYSKPARQCWRIRIHRIRMFLGLLDPDLDPDLDPLVRGTDPDPSITKEK